MTDHTRPPSPGVYPAPLSSNTCGKCGTRWTAPIEPCPVCMEAKVADLLRGEAVNRAVRKYVASLERGNISTNNQARYVIGFREGFIEGRGAITDVPSQAAELWAEAEICWSGSGCTHDNDGECADALIETAHRLKREAAEAEMEVLPPRSSEGLQR